MSCNDLGSPFLTHIPHLNTAAAACLQRSLTLTLPLFAYTHSSSQHCRCLFTPIPHLNAAAACFHRFLTSTLPLLAYNDSSPQHCRCLLTSIPHLNTAAASISEYRPFLLMRSNSSPPDASSMTMCTWRRSSYTPLIRMTCGWPSRWCRICGEGRMEGGSCAGVTRCGYSDTRPEAE